MRQKGEAYVQAQMGQSNNLLEKSIRQHRLASSCFGGLAGASILVVVWAQRACFQRFSLAQRSSRCSWLGKPDASG
jgi:hypothetical protein